MNLHFNVKALVVVLFIVGVVAAACAPAAAPTTSAPPASTPVTQATSAPPTPTAAAPAAKAVTLQIVSQDTLGKFLADGDGNTLYLFTKDTKGTSNCYDKCAQAWPPVLPSGQPTLNEGVSADLIATTARTDGSIQLTYNGWPLYYYAADQTPGDVNGQAVGDVWWVVSGEGNPIKPASVALTPTDSLGNILVDGSGMTLYLFTKDARDVTNCYGQCEQNWPPLLTIGDSTLGDGVASALISTTLRQDGSTQLTYNGWPLYYYFADAAPGDTTGQSVGNVWWVVSGEGNPIKPAALTVTQSESLGALLVDGDGRTLYIFTKDTANTSACYDKCEQNWPPLLQIGAPTLGDGVDATRLGTATRKDGTTQVTYNGMPLYYFFQDKAPGDTTGQGVGEVWYILSPDGTIVK